MFCVAIRPLSLASSEVEPYLEELISITGMAEHDIRRHFTGSSATVLKVSNDSSHIYHTTKTLKDKGFKAIFLSIEDIKNRPSPKIAKTIKSSAESLDFIDFNGEKIASVRKTSNCIIILSCEAIKKELFPWAYTADFTAVKEKEKLSYIFSSSPKMILFVSGDDTPIIIDATKFDYSSLNNFKSTARDNFPLIIERIKKAARSVLVDTGHITASLPFIFGEAKDAFEAYSRFVLLTVKGGLFDLNCPNARFKTSTKTELSSLEDLLFTGPFIPHKLIRASGDKAAIRPTQDTQFFNFAVIQHKPKFDPKAWFERFTQYPGSYPIRVLMFYIAGITMSSIVLLRDKSNFEMTISLWSSVSPYILKIFSIGVLLLGCFSFVYSLILMKKKQDIDNCPTSKIGSMPMGEVEVYGEAKPKYFLRAPCSLASCVYFSYEVYKEIPYGENGTKVVLVEAGYSGNVPFFLEDSSGTVTVLPENGEFKGGTTTTYEGKHLQGLFLARKIDGTKVIETVVHSGTKLYVKGYARRLTSLAMENSKNKARLLAELKRNKELLNSFDFNNDGVLDDAEWNAAVKSVDRRIVEDLLIDKKSTTDHVAIGEHPFGGLFYISEKSKKHIVSSMKRNSRLLLTFGVVLTSIGVYLTLKML